MPAFNAAQYLDECLASVTPAASKAGPWEIVVVDDGSTDATADIAAAWALRDARVRLVHLRKNRGLSVARNRGLGQCRGRFVHFLDADDRLAPALLSDVVEMASTKNLDIAHFDAGVFIDMSDAPATAEQYAAYYRRPPTYSEVTTGTALALELLENDHWRSSACLQLFSRSFLRAHRLSFARGLLHEDNLFTAEANAVARRVAHVAVPAYERRIRAGSITTSAVTERHVASLRAIARRLSRRAQRASGQDRELFDRLSARLANDAELASARLAASRASR
ncbi:heptose III glucuronosyltransferase [Microcella putealis]|uniref:Heptose III glucuronosyltransferase n=1 Tax=Microcella putealis TaxID=337005 RepID=A0A4V2EWW4_9MICO|nr:glycosyltransferase [Microcella putealis]RZS57400.1 heptose III glucuronosyltransferase [Microcella putealis]TQM19457.1 heptose III glucuronosyltransferase [Microcella putealis]